MPDNGLMSNVLGANGSVLPKTLPARLARHEQAYSALRPHFQKLLTRLSREQHVINQSSQVVLNVLERAVPQLEQRLGNKFLGLALGGSLANGLGTPRTSDVDFYLYVDGAGKRKAEECVAFLRSKLEENGLRVCDGEGYYDFGEEARIRPEAVASIFANYLIRPRFEPQALARRAVEQMLEKEKIGQGALEAELEDLFYDYSCCETEAVVTKFLRNMAQEHLPQTKDVDVVALSLSYQYPLVKFLAEQAHPYILKRVKMLPLVTILDALFD
jgi:hypothetical protein